MLNLTTLAYGKHDIMVPLYEKKKKMCINPLLYHFSVLHSFEIERNKKSLKKTQNDKIKMF
jgi:hypothetical protein